MESAGAAVQGLKPIFLMSPLSVAQFLPPGRLSFDLLVIDEASQVPPEGALGAIARCRRMIVVGDDKQLPPTNFFRMVAADDGDGDGDAGDAAIPPPARTSDFESILTLAKVRGVAERMLRWHYRSRHPSLIAVSNQICYGGELLLPPSPLTIGDDLGLSLVKTPRGHYDRGGSGRNPAEAELIAGAVEEHLAKCPGRSLGIACFSIAQRDAVDDALQARGVLAAAEAFAPDGERLFVKNLEAVQGDERNVIFISVGYGPDAQGRMTASFGPVSQDGGERRLNVLISRARRQCIVFSSITAGDIPGTQAAGNANAARVPAFCRDRTDRRRGGQPGRFRQSIRGSGRDGDPPRRLRGRAAGRRVGISHRPRRPGPPTAGAVRARDRMRRRGLSQRPLGARPRPAAPTGSRRARLEALSHLEHQLVPRPGARGRAALEGDRAGLRWDGAPDFTRPPEPAPSTEKEPEAIVIPEIARPALFEPYRESGLPAARGLDLLGLARPQLAALAAKVVCEEGPIHLEEVAKRVRQAFGLDRTSRRISRAVGAALELAERQGSVTRDGLFWSPRDRALTRPRCRRDAAEPLRRPDRIAPCEYRVAISVVLRACAGAARLALIADVAHVLGFDRIGNGLDRAISQEIDAMITAGEIVSAADSLRSAPPHRAEKPRPAPCGGHRPLAVSRRSPARCIRRR